MLELRSRVLAPGDALRGRVTLSLVSPFDGRGLSVVLSATRRSVTPTPGKVGLTYRRELVWQGATVLDGERVYRDGASYPVELLVPDDVLETASGEVEWTATAQLSHPWKSGLKQTLKVRVVTRPARRVRQKPRRRMAE